MQKFPNDINRYIFSFFRPNDLKNTKLVNKKFKEFSDERTRESFVYLSAYFQHSSGVSIKEFFSDKAVSLSTYKKYITKKDLSKKFLFEFHDLDTAEKINARKVRLTHLLFAGASPIESDEVLNPGCPLRTVISHAMNDFAKLLIDLECDLADAVVAASRSGNLEILLYLQKKGADLNSKDKNGESAIYWAAGCAKIETLHFLLKNGADPKTAKLEDCTEKVQEIISSYSSKIAESDSAASVGRKAL